MKSSSERTLPLAVTSSAARSTSVPDDTWTTACGPLSGALAPLASTCPMVPQPSGHDRFVQPFNSLHERVAVIAHLEAALGPHSGKGSVTFLGTETIDVLRFGPAPDGL